MLDLPVMASATCPPEQSWEGEHSLYLLVHQESGKSYVGIAKNVAARFRSHRLAAGGCPHLHKAIRKYGADAFDWRILASGLSRDLAGILEKDAIRRGLGHYNLTLGGEGTLGYKHTEEHCKNVGDRFRGVPKSEEHKNKIRAKALGRKRAPYTPEHCANMGASISATLANKPPEWYAARGVKAWQTKREKVLLKHHMTSDQLKDIQAEGIDWTGMPLRQDGILGVKSQWYLYLQSLDKRRERIVRTALKYYQMPVKENAGQPNRGFWIDKFQVPTGQPLGIPWCLAFVSSVLTEAGADWPIYHASAAAAMAWAATAFRIVKEPLPGDVFCFLYPPESSLAGHGHGGIVIGSDGSWIADCDGNVGDSVKVGYRAKAGLTFIRSIEKEAEAVMPQGLERLDGHGTR